MVVLRSVPNAVAVQAVRKLVGQLVGFKVSDFASQHPISKIRLKLANPSSDRFVGLHVSTYNYAV
jgi:hypothetical protein